MRRYARLLITYAVIAIAAMVLYTPWLVGLSPADPSIVRASLSVIFAIVLAGGFVSATYSYLAGPPLQLLSAAEVTDSADVLPSLRACSELALLGSMAEDAQAQVEAMDRRSERLNRLVDTKFGEASLSHDKFATVVDAAKRTLLRNCATLCNRMQAFDTEGYRKAQRQLKAPDAAQDSTASAQAELYTQALSDMQSIVEANDRLLLEMGRLEMELADLDANSERSDNSSMLEAVQELVEQTKYYR